MTQEPSKMGTAFGPKVLNQLCASSLPFICTRNVENYLLSAYPSHINVNTSAHFLRTEAWKQASYYDSKFSDTVPRVLLYNTLVDDAVQRRLYDNNAVLSSSSKHSSSSLSTIYDPPSSSMRALCTSCITSCTHDDEHFIVYATGLNLSRIRIQSIKSTLQSSSSTHEVHEKQFSSRIHDVRCVGQCDNGMRKGNSHLLVQSFTELTHFITTRDEVNGHVKLELLKNYQLQVGIRCMTSTDVQNQYLPMAMLIGCDGCIYKWMPEVGVFKHSDISPMFNRESEENDHHDSTACHLELSIHPQISYFALKTAIYTIDNRQKTIQPVQLFKFTKPIGSLLQHRAFSNYVITSVVGQLSVSDIRSTRYTLAQRPTPYTHDRMKFHKVANTDTDVVMGYAKNSQQIMVHSLCINACNGEDRTDNAGIESAQCMASNAVFSCVGQPSMTSVALNSRSFPVVDATHPDDITLIGAEILTAKGRFETMTDIDRGFDETILGTDNTYLFHQSYVGDIYAQELRMSNSKSVIHDELPCGVIASALFPRKFIPDTCGSLSDYDIYDDNLNKYPLASSNILPIVEDFNVRKFDVLEITASNLRLPRHKPRVREKKKVTRDVKECTAKERGTRKEKVIGEFEKQKKRELKEEESTIAAEEFTTRFNEAHKKGESKQSIKKAMKQKSKSKLNVTGHVKSLKVSNFSTSFNFDDHEESSSLDGATDVAANEDRSVESDEEYLLETHSNSAKNTEAQIIEGMEVDREEVTEFESFQRSNNCDQESKYPSDRRGEKDKGARNTLCAYDDTEDLQIAQDIMNIAMDALLSEMNGIKDYERLKSHNTTKSIIKDIPQKKCTHKLQRGMTLWEIWYFVVGVHLLKMRNSCDLKINALRRILLLDFEETLLSPSLVDQGRINTSPSFLNSDGLSVHQRSSSFICSCVQDLSRCTTINGVALCERTHCLAPHHLLYIPKDSDHIKLVQGNKDKDAHCNSMSKLRDMSAESDVTNLVIQQLQEAWPLIP